MAELRPHGEGRIDVQGESIQVPADYATALALVFHELATNAAKYGALSTPTGRLFVSWKTTSERIQIAWLEDSGIAVVAPEKGGFGMKLITRLIDNMEGTMQNEFRSDGIVWRISFPLPDSEPQQLVPAQTPVSESPLPSPS